MGIGKAVDLSETYFDQNVLEVSKWLQTGNRSYSDKAQEPCWPPTQYALKLDSDQLSITSVDDSVSISDSNHESCSSESSSHTAYTNATDPTDFLDEDEREQTRSKVPYLGPQTTRFRDEAFEDEHNRAMHDRMDKERARCSTSLARASAQAYHLGAQGVLESYTPASSRSGNPSQQQKPTHGPAQTAFQDGGAEPLLRKSSTRRSSCSTKNQSPPCKLKRDTEFTDQFVSLLIIFATRLITAIWPLSASPPMMSTCFNGAGVLPLRVFIQETLKRSRASYSTLQVALYYLILLKARLPAGDFTKEQISGESAERKHCRAMQCGRRMFLSALMLASKYLQDRNYSARAWSKISGLRSNEINENEREYLALIDYSLHVPKDSFDNWSKIVISLSKLSKESPRCRQNLPTSDFGHSGNGSGNALADMVTPLNLEETDDRSLFSDEWWKDLICKLNPHVVKDATLAENFLTSYVPGYQMSSPNPYNRSKWDESATSPDSMPPVLDLNFSDALKSRPTEESRCQTPQTPIQMSPARTSVMPMQPQLRNLPTPQTTPRIAEGCQWSAASGRPSLRCSASVDALRNMRRQCIMNANLDRCPPPSRPHQYGLPPVRSLMRPAETIHELPSRSTTPSVSSPASVTSDSTVYTPRSRSSSISSSSSWSSCSSTVPRLRATAEPQFSSPLAQVSSLSSRYCNLSSVEKGSDVSVTRFNDEGYGSGEEPPTKFTRQNLATTSEVDAVHVLMSLATHSETASQSVTPTPQNYPLHDQQAVNESPRGHKRTLSKTDCSLQSHVRSILRNDGISTHVVEDSLPSFYDVAPKQLQMPTRNWATPRRALPNKMDTKRIAMYCARQHASAPNLASQFLKDGLTAVSY